MSAAARAATPIAHGVAPRRHLARRRHLSVSRPDNTSKHLGLRALSEPPKGDTESKAELFLREELERQGVDIADAIAPDSPEEIVEALSDEVQRLQKKEAGSRPISTGPTATLSPV